jgi:hypothetical protein
MSKKNKHHKLEICNYNGEISSLYLNDYRISGPKPYGGGIIVKNFKVTNKDLLSSIPEYQKVLDVLKMALKEHDYKCTMQVTFTEPQWVHEARAIIKEIED